MAQIAKTEADMAASSAKDAGDKVAELGKQTLAQAAEITRDAASHAETFVREGLQSVRPTVDTAAEVGQNTARRAREGMAENNQNLLDLLNEQARHNVHVLQTLTQTANWGASKCAGMPGAGQSAWRSLAGDGRGRPMLTLAGSDRARSSALSSRPPGSG